MKIAQECGQKWYLRRSWHMKNLFRTFSAGFAIGPIMFIKKGY